MNVSFLRNMTNMECVPCCRRRRWSLWKCCPRNTEWTRYSCYCMDGPWSISKTSNNFPTATRIAWVVWSLIWTTFITRARSAQRCNVLESSKTDIKEGLRRKTSCWTHRMYHRGTWYPLSSWTVTQSASYVPLRHPSDGKTCCRCQLITKKLRWGDTGIRLLVP